MCKIHKIICHTKAFILYIIILFYTTFKTLYNKTTHYVISF